MLVKVNGETKELNILYGAYAKFTYEGVAHMAGVSPFIGLKITCQVDDWRCELKPGHSGKPVDAEIDVRKVPEFTVERV